jgi:hypothetical protein
MKRLCIASTVKSEPVHNRKGTPDAINAMIFRVSISITFQWLSVKRLFCGLFPIGAKSERKTGFEMKKPDTFVRNAVIKSSGEW